MAKNKIYSTGQKCPQSGIWQAVGKKDEIALSRQDRFPPNNQEGARWKLTRATRT